MHGSNLKVPSRHLQTNGYVGWVVSWHSPSPHEFGSHCWFLLERSIESKIRLRITQDKDFLCVHITSFTIFSGEATIAIAVEGVN